MIHKQHDEGHPLWGWLAALNRSLRSACSTNFCKNVRVLPVVFVSAILVWVPITALLVSCINSYQLAFNVDVRTVYQAAIENTLTLGCLRYSFLPPILTVPAFLYVWVLYYKLVTSDAGTTAEFREWTEGGHGDIIVEECRKCSHVRYERTHHCSVCDTCVERFDHHCPWINNCIGESNQRDFIRFLFWIVACLLAYLPNAVMLFWLNTSAKKRAVILTRYGNSPELIGLIWAMAVFAFLIGVGLLLVFNAWLAANNAVQLDTDTGDLSMQNCLWTWYRPNLMYSKGNIDANLRATFKLKSDEKTWKFIFPSEQDLFSHFYAVKKYSIKYKRRNTH